MSQEQHTDNQTPDDSGSVELPCSAVVPTKEWDTLYWAYNCPLQMWPTDEGWRVINYMPRKETCNAMDSMVSESEMPQFCRNAAARLRNLASLFDAMATGQIDTIYYPDETVEEAITKRHGRD